MESDRQLNRWGLTFPQAVIDRLRKVGIYGQPQLSLEHQGRAKRYVVRGVESGGATADVGYYVSFADENGEALPWLQTLDSLAVNGPHAVVIAPVVTRIEMLRIARTYELCITRHRPVAGDRAPPQTSRRRTVSRRARLSGSGALGQRQGFERLRSAAILHSFRRGDRTANRICRRGKGRDERSGLRELLTSTLRPVGGAALGWGNGGFAFPSGDRSPRRTDGSR